MDRGDTEGGGLPAGTSAADSSARRPRADPCSPFLLEPSGHPQTQLFCTRLFLEFDQHLSDPSVSKEKSVNASRSSSGTNRF